MYDTIIIGGGAAGLFAAAQISKGETLLLEGSKKLGQKILISGGGMCNITNMDDVEEFLSHFGSQKKINFLKPALLNLPTDRTMKYLEDIGLSLTVRADGKVFPKSLKAQSVINALQREITQNKTRIKYNAKVRSIKVNADGFKIQTGEESFFSKKLVIATGGCSFPETGSDGSIFPILIDLGCKITTPTPALVGIKVRNYPFRPLAGNSVRGASIDFFREGETKRFLTSNGDLLFTHQGISGPVILNNSRDINRGDQLLISLIPTENREESRGELLEIINSDNKKSVKRFLKEIGLTTAMTELLVKLLKIDGTMPAKSLNKKIKSSMINHLLNYPLTVSDKIGFNGAMVTAGGVNLKEIDRKTMESKTIPGLYFAGEVMDIDGDTGGYNIQAAFSTAKLAADAINRE